MGGSYELRMSSVRTCRFPLVAAVLVAVLVPASGCGSSSSEAAGARYFQGVRDAVVRGAALDFAQGTGIGGSSYEVCVRGLLRKALDRPAITTLVQVYRRPGGQQFAAQALNALAAPLGARCGHRTYVPELVEASRALRAGIPTGAAVRTLGVTYGPYLGVRCRRAYRVGCDSVGIDVVFATAATRVTAVVGNLRVRLRTPGMHNAVPHHDWVGTFSNAGLERPRSPFHISGHRPGGAWGGNPALFVPVELQVDFVGGHRAHALFPRVFVSPGWG